MARRVPEHTFDRSGNIGEEAFYTIQNKDTGVYPGDISSAIYGARYFLTTLGQRLSNLGNGLLAHLVESRIRKGPQ